MVSENRTSPACPELDTPESRTKIMQAGNRAFQPMTKLSAGPPGTQNDVPGPQMSYIGPRHSDIADTPGQARTPDCSVDPCLAVAGSSPVVHPEGAGQGSIPDLPSVLFRAFRSPEPRPKSRLCASGQDLGDHVRVRGADHGADQGTEGRTGGTGHRTRRQADGRTDGGADRGTGGGAVQHRIGDQSIGIGGDVLALQRDTGHGFGLPGFGRGNPGEHSRRNHRQPHNHHQAPRPDQGISKHSSPYLFQGVQPHPHHPRGSRPSAADTQQYCDTSKLVATSAETLAQRNFDTLRGPTYPATNDRISTSNCGASGQCGRIVPTRRQPQFR